MVVNFSRFNTEKFKNLKPPRDNSIETFKEINEINKLKKDDNFVVEFDDVQSVFEKIVGKDMDIGPMVEKSVPIILKLKNYFNRPRPRALAKQYDIDLHLVELESMATPSYPSGHSTQGYLLANVLKNKYPEKSEELQKAADNISDSRNIARAHYKSDSEFGKMLGKAMADYLEKLN